MLRRLELRLEYSEKTVGKQYSTAMGGGVSKLRAGDTCEKVSLAREALEIEKIVYAPLIKTHHAADFTGSIKLAMGFVKPFLTRSHST